MEVTTCLLLRYEVPMKNKIIYILLCSVCLLVSCSKQEEPPSIDYEKISSELTELLNTTEPYKYYSEWSKAKVIVNESSFDLYQSSMDKPILSIVEQNEQALIQVHMESTRKIYYRKGDESKSAYLSMSYDLNRMPKNQAIYCTLSLYNSPDIYKFYYDNELNIIYEYNQEIQEELIFVKSLQQQILSYCEEFTLEINSEVQQLRQIATWLLSEMNISAVPWHADYPYVIYEYNLMDHSDEYEIIFEDFEPDEIYPLYHRDGQEVSDGLYVIKKDGLYGVINKERQLVMPFISTTIPTAEEHHVHYEAAEQYKNTASYYFPYSHYQICQGQHGLNGYYYYLIEGTDKVIKTEYGHEGPLAIIEFEENELNGQLNTYELIEISETSDNFVWVESTRYHKTGKYGVFSEDGIVTDAVYDDALSINSDLAMIKKGKNWGYVDASGNEVIPCIYNTILDNGYQEFVYPAADGYIVVKNDKGMFGVLNYSGEVLVPFNYEAASPYLDETVLLKKDNKWIQANPFTASYVSMDYSLSSGTVKDKSYKNPSIGLKLDYTANSTVSTRYATEDIHLKHGERFNDLTLENNGAKLFIDFIKIDGSQDMNDEELYKAIISEYTDLFSNLYIGFWHEKEIGDLIFRECSATIGTGTSIINNFYFRRHGEYIVLIRLDYDFEKTDLGSQWIESIQKCNNILDLGMGTLPEGELIYFGNPETNDTFKPIGFPTFVLVDQTNRYIEFGFEGGFEVDPENNPNFALYTGTLTEIDDQIYSSKGSYHYLDYQGNLDDFVKKNVDFYLVLKRDRLYVILQEMTLEELKAYESEDFYLLDLDL